MKAKGRRATSVRATSKAAVAGHAGAVAAIVVLAVGVAIAQPAPPTNTQCSQWDEAYLDVFNAGLVLVTAGTLVLSAVAGLLGRLAWLLAAPRLRIFVVALVTFALAEVAVVATPWLFGFGILWFSGIGQGYFECLSSNFGAKGLLSGLIGPNIAALAQGPGMTYLLAGGAVVSALVALVVSEGVARIFGLRRRARREAA